MLGTELPHVVQARAEGPEAPSPGHHPGYKRNQPYCYGAVLWLNGPTSLIYHQHLFNIATSQQALCSEPCIAI